MTDYISRNMKDEYILSSYIDYPILGRFPGRLESYMEIVSKHFSNNTIENYEQFEDFLWSKNVKGLLVLESDETELKDYAQRYKNAHEEVQTIVDEKAILYVLDGE